MVCSGNYLIHSSFDVVRMSCDVAERQVATVCALLGVTALPTASKFYDVLCRRRTWRIQD